ncbi:MAG: glycogen/starch synthase [Tannerella sp.]|jgi:glycosyltransferase involved in cell wall biosynthesis|nr:glycogen/starch synthase [Tannerella sp.]
MIKLDYIFESSWEVCNKVGGIYTVLSSKARTLKNDFEDGIIFIGPDLNNNPNDFMEDDTLFREWKRSLPENLKIRTGRWKIPGEPLVFLVSYKTFFDRRDSLYYDMWNCFRVNSSHAYGDYDNSCIFAYATGLVIENFYRFHELTGKKVVAVFNEWMLGMGALYVQKYVPDIATLFVTHATTTGRSIAGNHKPLYSCLKSYNGDQMAKELNVEAKHSLEKQTAVFADCFATVSEITALECKQLLDKAPDVVTPNGFEKDFVPAGDLYTEKRAEARRKLMYVTEKLTGRPVAKDAFLVSTSGRYEYRNKGIDVFIDVMNSLRRSGTNRRETVAFIMVPAWVYAARADLKYVLENDYGTTAPLQTPFLTHWLNNMNEDPVMNYIFSSGFTNTASENVRIIFVPCYLDGHDEIFNVSYYDLLIGMDATVFASYYEPWGYTPLESIAFGVPAVTTNLAGFGMWASTLISGNDIKEGVSVINRTDDNYFEVVNNIADALSELMNADDALTVRNNCFRIARQAEWDKFINHYYAAFNIAFANAGKRNGK